MTLFMLVILWTSGRAGVPASENVSCKSASIAKCESLIKLLVDRNEDRKKLMMAMPGCVHAH